MGKNKLIRYRDLQNYNRIFQPPFNEVYRKNYYHKGNWAKEVFQNENPLVLELGCGKGEYTIGLARLNPRSNFMGLDIKGDRIWKGVRIAHNEQIPNVAFVRTSIEFITSFYDRGEVDEIWITFPDPQEKKRRSRKRLTAARFLNLYRQILKEGGSIHLKTDNDLLYQYTLRLLKFNNMAAIRQTEDLYGSWWSEEALSIQTFYESRFREEGALINYLEFRLPVTREIKELPDERS